MDENAIGEAVLGCALKVHRALGPGLLENAYETCLAIELRKAGLNFTRQAAMPVFYDGEKIELGYRLDLLIENRVVAEVKAVDKIADIHRAQLLSYLKLGGFRLGYLLNFNVSLMKDGMIRMVHGL